VDDDLAEPRLDAPDRDLVRVVVMEDQRGRHAAV